MKLDPRTLSAYFDALRVEYGNGDPNALLRAMRTCLDQRCAVPPWAAEAFLRALSRWYAGRARTLDEALGFKLATPKRTANARRERLQLLRVFNAMHIDRLEYPDAPISDATFARVGKACQLSAATAKRRYYAAMKDPELRGDSPSRRALSASLLARYVVHEPAAESGRKSERAKR